MNKETDRQKRSKETKRQMDRNRDKQLMTASPQSRLLLDIIPVTTWFPTMNHCLGDHNRATDKKTTLAYFIDPSLIIVRDKICSSKISAKRGPDSRFVVEANIAWSSPKLRQSRAINLMNRTRVTRPRVEYNICNVP